MIEVLYLLAWLPGWIDEIRSSVGWELAESFHMRTKAPKRGGQLPIKRTYREQFIGNNLQPSPNRRPKSSRVLIDPSYYFTLPLLMVLLKSPSLQPPSFFSHWTSVTIKVFHIRNGREKEFASLTWALLVEFKIAELRRRSSKTINLRRSE